VGSIVIIEVSADRIKQEAIVRPAVIEGFAVTTLHGLDAAGRDRRH
jgi:hypothetical protein